MFHQTLRSRLWHGGGGELLCLVVFEKYYVIEFSECLERASYTPVGSPPRQNPCNLPSSRVHSSDSSIGEIL